VSILVIKDLDLNNITIYEFNVLIALAAVETRFEMYGSYNSNQNGQTTLWQMVKKLPGILIENTYKSNLNFTAVV